jgi:hypothetical protein
MYVIEIIKIAYVDVVYYVDTHSNGIVQTLRYCFLFSKTVFKNSLPNTFLTKKQQKTVFLFLFSKTILKNKNQNQN